MYGCGRSLRSEILFVCVCGHLFFSSPNVLLVRACVCVCVCVCLRDWIGEEMPVFWTMSCLSSTLRIPFGNVGAAHA